MRGCGLKSDGTLVAAGRNNFNQCNVESVQDAVDIAAEYDSTVVLKSNGTVETIFKYGNIEGHDVVNTYNWSNIIDIEADNGIVVGLKEDGSVVQAGLRLSDLEAFESKGW